MATHNRHKAEEIQAILPAGYILLTLTDIGYHEAIEETGFTFEENAAIKAGVIYDYCGKPTLADDSGLEVDALDGAPGVYSARYAGEGAGDAANNAKLLDALREVEEHERKAQFVCVLAYRAEGITRFFKGTVKGTIQQSHMGDGGFGYDPLFVPEGHEISFAQMASAEKNAISHRRRALEKWLEYMEDAN